MVVIIQQLIKKLNKFNVETKIGQIVNYVLSSDDAIQINRRRTYGQSIAERIKEDKWPIRAQAHIGNPVEEKQVYPMIIIRVWSESLVNGQVFLDGTDSYWVTSANRGGEGVTRTWY